MDDFTPQNIRSGGNGDCTSKDDSKEAIFGNRGIFLRIRRVEPHRSRDRDRPRRHEPRPERRLDLRHLDGARHRSLRLRGDQPFDSQGLQASEQVLL